MSEEVEMPIYKTILQRKEEVADETMAFHFEKPAGFAFKAGQFGDFTLIGIGVTPVRSIILQATHDNLPHKIFLFDSNRRPEDAAFLNHLMEAQEKNPNYTFVGTMTQMEKSPAQ